jgi:hypothetical protein
MPGKLFSTRFTAFSLMRLLTIFAGLLLFITCPVHAQTPYPYDPVQDVSPDPLRTYHGSNIDSVDLDTGNLSVRIPLVSYPQRGGVHHLNFSYNYSGINGVPGGALVIQVYRTDPLTTVGKLPI